MLRFFATKVSIAKLRVVRLRLIRIVSPCSVRLGLFLRLRMQLTPLRHVDLVSETGMPLAVRLSAVNALLIRSFGTLTPVVVIPLVIMLLFKAASAQPVSKGITAELALIAV